VLRIISRNMKNHEEVSFSISVQEKDLGSGVDQKYLASEDGGKDKERLELNSNK
jgi:hypothetical protein